LNVPDQFLKLGTDELTDIGRKLDTGVELLKTLPSIKTGIDTLNSKFDDFSTDQREHNKRMDEHNKRMDEHNKQLTHILQKLSEK